MATAYQPSSTRTQPAAVVEPELPVPAPPRSLSAVSATIGLSASSTRPAIITSGRWSSSPRSGKHKKRTWTLPQTVLNADYERHLKHTGKQTGGDEKRGRNRGRFGKHTRTRLRGARLRRLTSLRRHRDVSLDVITCGRALWCSSRPPGCLPACLRRKRRTGLAWTSRASFQRGALFCSVDEGEGRGASTRDVFVASFSRRFYERQWSMHVLE